MVGFCGGFVKKNPRKTLIFLYIIFFLISSCAHAKEGLDKGVVNVSNQHVTLQEMLNITSKMMKNGDFETALSILNQVSDFSGNEPEVLFRKGLIFFELQDYEKSVYYYRKILLDEPNAVRVRLELARSLFELGRYTEAEREFRFARTGDLPAPVYANIDRYIAAIQYNQTLRWNFSLSIAPDDNINSAPDITRIGPDGVLRLDGFEKSSGLGLVLNTGVEWTPRVNESTRLRVGTNLYHTEYSGSEFDDSILSYHVGPRFDRRNMSVSTLLTGYKRWYQHEEHSDAVGGRVEIFYRFSSRLRASFITDYQEVSYKRFTSNDGHRKGVSGTFDYALTESSGIQVTGGFFRESTQRSFNSSDSYRVGIGYYRELAHGINIFLQPEYTLTKYDDVNPIHTFFLLGNEKRKDETYRFNVSLSHRQWQYKGFTPTILFIHSQRKSNYELYDFSRNQVQLGVRRIF